MPSPRHRCPSAAAAVARSRYATSCCVCRHGRRSHCYRGRRSRCEKALDGGGQRLQAAATKSRRRRQRRRSRDPRRRCQSRRRSGASRRGIREDKGPLVLGAAVASRPAPTPASHGRKRRIGGGDGGAAPNPSLGGGSVTLHPPPMYRRV